MLDTRHFHADFTDRLLASFDDLDGMTDGLLIHSENWQALRLTCRKSTHGQCAVLCTLTHRIIPNDSEIPVQERLFALIMAFY